MTKESWKHTRVKRRGRKGALIAGKQQSWEGEGLSVSDHLCH